MMPDSRIKVVTWKWDGGVHDKKNLKFSAEHVNRFFRMLDRNTTVDYEPVCITDDPTGIDPHIRIIPLWDDLRELKGCYVRLKAFADEMKNIIGERFIWMDIDAIICGNVDHILNDPHEFKMWGDTHPRTPYNGSMCLMTAGCRSRVWTHFKPGLSPQQARQLGYVGTDQAWIGTILGRNEAKWSVHDGVYSFRIHFDKTHKTRLPSNACIVMFHGRHDPSQEHVQSKYPWVKQHWR